MPDERLWPIPDERLVRLDDPRLDGIDWPKGVDRATSLASYVRSGGDSKRISAVRSWAEEQLTVSIDRAARELVQSSLARASRGDQDRWIPAMIARLGLEGSPPVTLEVAGRLVGVTRERVRQVQAKMMERRPPLIWVPALDAAIALALDGDLRSVEEFQADLLEDGIAEGPWSLESLDAFLSFVGHPRREPLGKGSLVGRAAAGAKDLARVARAHAGKLGITRAAWVSADTGEPDAVIEAVLRSDSRFKDVGNGWFVIVDAIDRRNRLANSIRKMLSLGRELSVEVLAEGFSRIQRFRGVEHVASADGVRRFVDWHSDFERTDGDLVRSVVELDWREQLGPDAQTLVEIMQALPQRCTDRLSLMESAESQGIAEGTISVWSTYNPILWRPATNCFALVGVTPTPAEVSQVQEAAAKRAARDGMQLSHGWAEDGRYRVTLRPGPSLWRIGSLPVTLPIPVGDGSIPCVDRAGKPIGSMSLSDSFVWGLRNLMRTVADDPTQTIEFLIDVVADEAEVGLV